MFSVFSDTVWQFVVLLVRSYSYRHYDRKSDRKILVISNMG